MTYTSSNADVLMRAFASDWGKGKPPTLEGAMHPEAELIVPEGMPYGGGVFRGQERIGQWFAEDLWQLWAEFSSTPTDFIDGGEKVVVPVHVKGKTHDGAEVEADNVWIYEFEDGALRRARVLADTATIRDAVTGGTMVAGEQVPEPMQMVQMLGAFQLSQALYVVAKLGVSSALVDGPRTIEDLAARTGANADALGRIVRTLAPLGLFWTDDHKVGATDLGLTLAEGHPGSVRDIALFLMETHYAPFGELLRTATTGESAATHYYGKPFFDWISEIPELAEVMTGAMASITTALRAGMFDGYSLPDGNVVADIGGADGSMLCELLAHEPQRRGIVFDRPEIVPAARKALADHGLADRVEIQSGDFFESVPTADVYILSYILHDWDDESCRRILQAITNAAAPGARIVLVESVITPGDAPDLAKTVDLTMLAMVTGRERTAYEYERLLAAANCTIDRIVPSPTPFSFIEATVG